jgi:hypothetical protein
MLGYFFGPCRPELPSLADVHGLHAADAVLVRRFGDLGLLDGTWPVLGRVDGWDRSAWPMPAFVHHESLTDRSVLVYYDEDDPNKCLSRRRIPLGASTQGPKDGLMGSGFAEITLTNLLAP